jgi:hypothetical protein
MRSRIPDLKAVHDRKLLLAGCADRKSLSGPPGRWPGV